MRRKVIYSPENQPTPGTNPITRMTKLKLCLRLLWHRKLTLCVCGAILFILLNWYMQSESFLIEEFKFPVPPTKTSPQEKGKFSPEEIEVKRKKSLSKQESQAYVNYMADNFVINFTVIQNSARTCIKKFSIYNAGQSNIPSFFWAIYFYDNGKVGHNSFPYPRGLPVDNSELLIFHEAGNLYRLSPTEKFSPYINSRDTIEVPYESYGPHVSRHYSFPNWFVSCDICSPRILKSTAGEDLSFVETFSKPQQLKRDSRDLYRAFTAKDRFSRNSAAAKAPKPSVHSVIPTPLRVDAGGEESLVVTPSDWVVSTKDFVEEASLLAEKLNLKIAKSATSKVITFSQGKVTLPKNSSLSISEAYHIYINPSKNTIEVTANEASGAFYAAQTLLSLTEKDRSDTSKEKGHRFPGMNITDAPRFEYRGLMLDVSRNFVQKATVLKLLDLMATYKVNKFHFHLTDDDAWRLEIPEFPELTKYASNRCLDPSHEVCLPPSLGSGPFVNTSGSGFYTVSDYKEILRYAKSRHIEVIPEIDVPGHARSAIQAMELRYRRTKNSMYRLIDPDDRSRYLSAQSYTDDAVNPCVDGTYQFFKVILRNLQELHKDIQPLTFYMLGGDEVAGGAWEKSPACADLKQKHELRDYHDLKKFFFKRMMEELRQEDLTFGLWGDAVLDKSLNPNRLEEGMKGKVYTYSWSNVWEWKRGSLAYKLANAGYKVVMSPATYFYFDQPYEPDFEERGLYWATRCLDSRTAFSFVPDHLYWNRGRTQDGGEMTDEILCTGGCPPLTQPQNIRGIQADLWTETIRTPQHLHYMLFPRFLAFAERAWHKASWEDLTDVAQRDKEQQKDWERFAAIVGKEELERLESEGVEYRLDPPGARFSNSILEINTIFPGLPTEYSLNQGASWEKYNPKITTKLSNAGKILVRSSSFDGKRKSRVVSVENSN